MPSGGGGGGGGAAPAAAAGGAAAADAPAAEEKKEEEKEESCVFKLLSYCMLCSHALAVLQRRRHGMSCFTAIGIYSAHTNLDRASVSSMSVNLLLLRASPYVYCWLQ